MVIYCISISLQLAGALVLLINGLSTRKDDIVKSFAVKNIIIQNGNTKELNDLSQAINKKLENAYYNRAAFTCLATGYILGVFGNINEIYNKFHVSIFILFITFVIMFMIKSIIKWMMKKANFRVTPEELEELDIKPDLVSISNEEIDEIFRR